MFSVAAQFRKSPVPCPPTPIPAMFSLSLGERAERMFGSPKTWLAATAPAATVDCLRNSRRDVAIAALLRAENIDSNLPRLLNLPTYKSWRALRLGVRFSRQGAKLAKQQREIAC
jgi:hypothetical protein